MHNDNGSKLPDEHLRAQTARIIDFFVVCVGVAALPIGILVHLYAYKTSWSIPELFQMGSFGAIMLIAISKDSLSLHVKTHSLIFFLLVAALADISHNGLMTATMPLLVILPVLSTIVGGFRSGLATTAMITAAMICLAVAMVGKEQLPSNYLLEMQLSAENWALHIFTLGFAACVAVLVTGTLYRFQHISGKKLNARDRQFLKTQTRVLQSAKLAGLGYAVLDAKIGRIVECDTVFAEMHGFTISEVMDVDLQSGSFAKNMHEDDRERAAQTLKSLSEGKVVSDEFRYRLPDGKTRSIRKIFSPVVEANSEIGLVEIICQDVSEARKLQDQLIQTQKMDAIGKLTGGVAHDFNNLLSVTLGNLELLDDQVSDLDQKELIKNSINSTLRGAELTRNMLSFARKAPLEPKTLDLNQLVRNMESWIGRTLPSNIKVETSLSDGLWETVVDPSSTEAGLLNLILNARDAMPGGGKLTIKTSNIRVNEDWVKSHDEDLELGQYVVLVVSDTGEGISSEHMSQIFEPFFTTKPVGAGSGLGLSMIEGFMRQSKGAVRAHSEPNVGTTFKLYFRASTHAKTNMRATHISDAEVGAFNGTTVLLVEDNAEVLIAMQATLIKSGFRVLHAASGDEAYTIFTQESDIDLLLTDIVMPGALQGTSLAKALRELRPSLPVVFMSGYASEATVHENGFQSQDIRLMKPVRRENLLRAVKKALLQTGENTPKT